MEGEKCPGEGRVGAGGGGVGRVERGGGERVEELRSHEVRCIYILHFLIVRINLTFCNPNICKH